MDSVQCWENAVRHSAFCADFFCVFVWWLFCVAWDVRMASDVLVKNTDARGRRRRTERHAPAYVDICDHWTKRL